MAVSPDLLFQLFSTVHSDIMPKPGTIASAATVAPTSFLTEITGTVAIATITPPTSAMHMLALLFTNATPTAFLTSGNVATAVAPVDNVVVLLVYHPQTAKYYGVG